MRAWADSDESLQQDVANPSNRQTDGRTDGRGYSVVEVCSLNLHSLAWTRHRVSFQKTNRSRDYIQIFVTFRIISLYWEIIPLQSHADRTDADSANSRTWFDN